MKGLIRRYMLEERLAACICHSVFSLVYVAFGQLRPDETKAFDRCDEVGLEDELGEGWVRRVWRC